MSTTAEMPTSASRVLIVDDDRGLRALIERSLRGLGIEPSQADCGEAALSWLRENTADLIVLDLRLPDMDAGQLIEQVTGEGLQTDFVIITGYGDERVAVEMMKRGARDYLMKDEVFLERLPAVVDQVLRELSREKRLQEAEEAVHLLEAAVRHLADGVVIVSGDGQCLSNEVLYSNPAMELLTGLDAQELVGHPLSHVLCHPGSERARDHIEGSIGSGLACSERAQFGHPSGRTFPVDIDVAPVRNKAGQVTHHIILLRDVSEKERLEQKSQNAQRMEALGQLAGGVAHDFNNVLTVIFGHAELLAMDIEEQSPGSQSIHQIQHAAEHASALTNQLLSFSRQQTLQACVFDLSDKIARTHKMIERVIGENIEFVTDYWQGPLLVCMDPAQVEQVLMNLVINSRDAMPGGGRIHLETRLRSVASLSESNRQEANNPLGYAAISVRDEGMGISPDAMQHIFEPFFTTKHKDGGGTGLGLSTVYGIVSKAGGWIDVDSTPGVGSTFDVYLPLDKGSAGFIPREAVEPVEPPRGSECVLVVEDDPAVRQLIQGVLEDFGYRVAAADSPAEALACAPEGIDGHAFDLVVSDVVMPGGGGPQMYESLRGLGLSPRVLFISGYARGQLTPADLEHFRAGFLRKPFTPGDLAIAVRKVLDRD